MSSYNKLNEYFKKKFSSRTLKVCIDGGFTCPNRDGTKGLGGCIFCSEKGSGVNLKSNLDISEQVKSILEYKKDRADKFIVYFQNFTNTYADINILKEKYDASLIDERIVGIDIDTRPDCINEEVCKLLSSYKDRYSVFVELGLQSVNSKTKELINQKTTVQEFEKALELLNKYQIETIVHVMIGLPNETHQDIVNLVEFLNKHKYQGIKIHSTYIVKNTLLEIMYKKGIYNPLSYETYMDELVYILTHISPDVVVHRISGDPSKKELVAPDWTLHKKKVLNGIEKKLLENKLYQGIYYSK